MLRRSQPVQNGPRASVCFFVVFMVSVFWGLILFSWYFLVVGFCFVFEEGKKNTSWVGRTWGRGENMIRIYCMQILKCFKCNKK